MARMTRAAILAVQDLKTVDVDVPEWEGGGGIVGVRMLTASERDEFDASLTNGTGENRTLNLHDLRARLLAICIVDDDDNPVFTPADVHALGAKSSAALSVLFAAAQKLNGMLPAAVETAVKN